MAAFVLVHANCCLFSPPAGCAVGLAKVMLGVGLVALPRSLLLLGTLPATLAFLVLGALCQLSCNALTAAATQAARSGLPAQRLSYSGVLAMQLGPWAALLLDVATVLNCLGMMTAYLIASGDVLVSDEWRAAGAPSWLAALLRSRPAVLALLSAAVLAPLLSFRWAAGPAVLPGQQCCRVGPGCTWGWVDHQLPMHQPLPTMLKCLPPYPACRRLKQTAAASALGVAAVLVWAAATAYLAAVLALRGQAHTLPLWPPAQLRRLPWHRALLRVAAVLPVILTAFM